MTFECFHATDIKIVDKIILDKFICKNNEEHWLGNGVYFYLDYSLALWWSTMPTKKFGINIENPAIVKCKINIMNNDDILDLRNLNEYQEFTKIYVNDFLPKIINGQIQSKNSNTISSQKIRCTYCDFLKNQYNIKGIIGTFNLPNQPYLPKNYGFGFKEFDILYTETQLCVFDQSIINDKIIINKLALGVI